MAMKSGGPAFPELGNVGHNSDWQSESGMALRDYFAAKAMLAIGVTYDDDQHAGIAETAYKMADAMIRAREAS